MNPDCVILWFINKQLSKGYCSNFLAGPLNFFFLEVKEGYGFKKGSGYMHNIVWKMLSKNNVNDDKTKTKIEEAFQLIFSPMIVACL